MAVLLPQWAAQDGRTITPTYDTNVRVWPGTKGGEYDANQSGTTTRASTTITACPEFETNQTCLVEWNGVNYFIPFNTSVTVPRTVYDIINTAYTGWVVT
jgi:hypothetical protein